MEEYETCSLVEKVTPHSTPCILKNGEATLQVNIVVKYSKCKYKTKGIKYFAYATYGMDLPISKTFKEYRKRFGIESRYKLMNQARLRTSTKKPVPRLLYVGLSLLLVHIWIYIPMDTSQHTTKRKPPTTNLNLQNHVKTNHPK